MCAELMIEVRGSGPDLVMLHGWAMNSRVWGDFADRLADHFRLHLVDLHSHGTTCGQSGEYSASAMAKEIARHTPAAIWLGWSLGGLIAIKAALEQAGMVQGLVLIAANPSFVVRSEWPFAQEKHVFDDFAQALKLDVDATLDRFNGIQVAGSNNARQNLRDLKSLAEASPDVQALQSGLNILRKENLTPRLKDIKVPSLLISGLADRLVPAQAMRKTAELIPNAHLHELEATGHAPFLDHAEQMAQLIREFRFQEQAA